MNDQLVVAIREIRL